MPVATKVATEYENKPKLFWDIYANKESPHNENKKKMHFYYGTNCNNKRKN